MWHQRGMLRGQVSPRSRPYVTPRGWQAWLTDLYGVLYGTRHRRAVRALSTSMRQRCTIRHVLATTRRAHLLVLLLLLLDCLVGLSIGQEVALLATPRRLGLYT